jgi:membrane protease YdiL (CAAX protease family)
MTATTLAPRPRTTTRDPLLAFAASVLPAGWVLLSVPVALDLPIAPFALATTLLVMLPAALLLSRGDPDAPPRRLLADARRLPVPPVWGLVALLAVPGLTWGLAAVAGEATPLTPGLAAGLAVNIVSSVLLINLWEELAWAGFVQRRATVRWGVLGGSLTTAVLFAAIHLPLAFDGAAGPSEIAVNVAALLVAAVGLRLLVATVDLRSGGSLLAVAVLHASFNASGTLVDADHDWLRYTAVLLLGLGLVRLATSRRRAAAS